MTHKVVDLATGAVVQKGNFSGCLSFADMLNRLQPKFRYEVQPI